MTKAVEVWEGRVMGGGRVVLPADLRRELGIKNGDAVFFRREGERVFIETHLESIRRAQALVRDLARKPFSVDEFLAERRQDAGKDA